MSNVLCPRVRTEVGGVLREMRNQRARGALAPPRRPPPVSGPTESGQKPLVLSRGMSSTFVSIASYV